MTDKISILYGFLNKAMFFNKRDLLFIKDLIFSRPQESRKDIILSQLKDLIAKKDPSVPSNYGNRYLNVNLLISYKTNLFTATMVLSTSEGMRQGVPTLVCLA